MYFGEAALFPAFFREGWAALLAYFLAGIIVWVFGCLVAEPAVKGFPGRNGNGEVRRKNPPLSSGNVLFRNRDE